MEYRVGHLAYRTKDLQATLAFYSEDLGFTHAFSIKDDNGNPWIEYVMTHDGRFIELFYPNGDAVPELGSSYMHLCLEVDDCAAAVAELESKGVAIMRPLKQGKDGNWQAWIRDPDGRDIELMQLVETSGQTKSRSALNK